MKLRYVIEDCEGLEVTAEFEFHRELDGMLVFEGAWNVVEVIGDDGDDITDGIDEETVDGMIHRWLSKYGEDLIYSEADRVLK